MHFGYTELHEVLRDAARGHLERTHPIEAFRKGLTPNAAYRRETRRLDAAQGWTAMMCGDPDVTVVEAMVVAEELGRAAHPGAFAVASAAAIAVAEASPDVRADRLAALQSGAGLIAAPAGSSDALAVASEGGLRITGHLRLVQDADLADELLIRAATDTGPVQLLVPLAAPGVIVRAVSAMDVTRAWFDVALTEVSVSPANVVVHGREVVRRQADIVSVLVAADSVGIAERLLEMTVAYAKERVAFGRPIAAFQAVKHRCADMLIRLESARVAVWYAAVACRDGREDAAEASAIAKFFATEAASWIAGEALQLHGGIGMTWEHDLHLMLKRAKANELLFGGNSTHRDTVARALAL